MSGKENQTFFIHIAINWKPLQPGSKIAPVMAKKLQDHSCAANYHSIFQLYKIVRESLFSLTYGT